MDSRPLFVLLYAASGTAALIYEVTWTRLLTLDMGHTVAAISIVLAAFMGGLSAGAWLGGRTGALRLHRLVVYAALELLIALFAIALPAGLHGLAPVMAWAYMDGDAPLRFTLARAALSLGLIAVPAAAMGATFPIAASWFAERPAITSSSAGTARASTPAAILYAANTAGAAAGAMAAGFWLIPAVGLRATTWMGVGLNVMAALGASWIVRRDLAAAPLAGHDAVRDAGSKASIRRPRQPSPAMPDAQPALASAAAALAGFTALVSEVAFTRLLALIIGPTTYAFATMAASFITGIALGSAAGDRLARRVPRPALWLGVTLLFAAASGSLAAAYAAGRLPLVVAAEVAAADATFQGVVIRQAADVAMLMLPMTLAFGIAFPLALALASSGTASVGRDAARVYVANTIGAVAGALGAGFVLIPRFGLQGTLAGTGSVAVLGATAVAAAALAPRRTRWRPQLAAAVIVASALCAALIATPRWDRNLLSSGAYKYAPYIHADNAADVDAMLRAGRLEYYKEGAAATVSVRRLLGRLSLAIDGKIDASNSGDMLTQRMLGVLPVLLHPDPQDLCVIGLGSGVTLASAMATGLVSHADAVEISPEVVEASAFFSKENGDILRAPGVRLVLGDGRSHLQLTKRHYDVIVSEPSNPWMAGVASLFTREFFAAARTKLKRDGVICQWAHTYDMSDRDLRSIVHTFATVFPESTMWRVGDGDLLLIGTTGKDIEARLANMADRCRRASIAEVLRDVGIEPAAAPFQLLSMFAGGPAALARYGSGASVQTDDRTALEFTAPASIYGRSTNANNAAIRALLDTAPLPAAVAAVMQTADAQRWTARGAMELKAEAYTAAYDSFRRAVTLDDRNGAALAGASDAAAGANRQDDHRAWLERLAKTSPANAAVRVALSRIRAAGGDFEGAIAAASEARRLEPGNPGPLEQLASVFADMEDASRLEPLADTLVARHPDRQDGGYYQAVALLLRGRAAEAAGAARRVLAVNPQHAKAQNLLGAACAALNERECARAAFDAALRLSPRESSSYVNAGLLSLQAADPARAAEYFSEALAVDPGSTAARDGLRQARAALGPR